MPADWIHIPTPGDHYSPMTGSAIITVIYELSRVHESAGGTSRVVVAKGTVEGYPPYDVGRIVAADLPEALPSRGMQAIDIAIGRLCHRRPSVTRAYAPACDAIEPGFDGAMFVYNCPGVIPLFRKRFPKATICLYSQNQLFGTYSNCETARIVDNADAIICVSQFIADDIASRVPTRRDKLKVVLNGVDVDHFAPVETKEQPDLPLILFLGRVVPEKGVDILLEAVHQLRSKGVQCRLRIVGSSNFNATDPITSFERRLRQYAQQMNGSVEFVPFLERAKVAQEYHAATVFCAPSRFQEPFGLTIAEAMACGIPVVASRQGGIPEVGGDAILYFDAHDPRQLSDQLQRLIADAEYRQSIAARGRTRAVELLDWRRRYETLVNAIGKH